MLSREVEISYEKYMYNPDKSESVKTAYEMKKRGDKKPWLSKA